MEKQLKFPVGLSVDNTWVTEAPFARTAGDAEEIYTTPAKSTELYSWFARILAVSIKSIGGIEVAKPFIESKDKGTEVIPTVLKSVPLNDVGSAILQIQTNCWQDIIKDQETQCKFCGDSLTGDIDLKKIPIPDGGSEIEFLYVYLGEKYKIETGVEALAEYEGQEYNCAVFRVPTLGDGIRNEKLNSDTILFWQAIAFDCLSGLCLIENEKGEYEEGGKVNPVTDGYVQKRGKVLFKKDWGSKTLNLVRKGVMNLPSAKFYYEEKCPCPRKKMVPYFVDVQTFFSV